MLHLTHEPLVKYRDFKSCEDIDVAVIGHHLIAAAHGEK